MNQSDKTGKIYLAVFLIEGIALYTLGVGIAKYLGFFIQWDRFALGWVWIVLLQLAGLSFRTYYVKGEAQGDAYPATVWGAPNKLMIGFALLACVASLTVLMMSKGYFRFEIVVLLILGVIGMLLVCVQPLLTYTAGFHEVLLTFLMTVFIPWFSFEIQAQEIHRLLAMVSFPLFTLRLAMMISLEFPTYALDLKAPLPTLLVKLGWQNGMFVHNLFIIFSFLLLGIAMILGFSPSIVIPPMFGSVIGAFQIYTMRRIALGDKPNWRGLVTGGISLYALVVYLLGYSFWIR